MFKRIIAAAIIGAAIAACGGQAQAADIAVKADDGQVFGLHDVYKIDTQAVPGFIRVQRKTSSNDYVSTGSLLNRILLATPTMIHVGNGVYIDTAYSARTSCQGGNTVVAMADSGEVFTVADGCQGYTAARNAAK
jgi:hypothetical protein